MINHRIENHWRCLLLLLITALSFPHISFSQAYTAFSAGGPDRLGANGFSYNASGGIDPAGQTVPMSQMLIANGSCGKNVICSQFVGLGKQDSFAYIVGFWNSTSYYPEGNILPGQSTQFSQLTTGVGWGQSGNYDVPGGAGDTYSNNFLQIIGLGANDGMAYLAAFQDDGGTWHGGGKLPWIQDVPFAQLLVAVGNNQQLQVIGRAASDNRLYLTAFQDREGNWNAEGLLPGQTPACSYITTTNIGNGIIVLGVGASDGYVYEPDWQDLNGNWHAAGVLPGQSTPLENIVIVGGLDSNGNGIVLVGGLGASDHILHIVDWLDYAGTWHAYGPPLSASIPQVPMTQVVSDGIDIYGISQVNNDLYLLFQNNVPGHDMTPNAGAALWLPAVLQVLSGM